MKRRTIILIVLGIVLGVVVGMTIYLTSTPLSNRSDSTKTEETNDEKLQRVPITNIDRDSIHTIELEREDEVLLLYRQGNEWHIKHPHPVEQDADRVNTIVSSIEQLYSERVVEENPQDLLQYGLQPPQTLIRVTLYNDQILTLYLGDLVPVGTGYYLMIEGNPTVYMVKRIHGEHFNYGLADVRRQQVGQINPKELQYLKIARHGRRTVELLRMNDENWNQILFAVSNYTINQPYKDVYPTDAEEMDELMSRLPAYFQIDRFVDDRPNNLAQYGLEKPSAELLVEDGKNTVHLYFGDDLDEKHIYFQVAGKKSVYAMEKYELEFMSLNPFRLVDKLAFIVKLDDVDTITVEYLGKVQTFSLVSNGEGQEQVTIYRVNGIEVKEKPFKELYRRLITLTVEGDAGQHVSENPEIRLVYSLNRGSIHEYTLSFVPYDVDFYALFRNGVNDFLISKEQVQSMLDDVEAFASEMTSSTSR